MTGPYVIGCDVGSQGTNCALYAADGTLVASSYQTTAKWSLSESESAIKATSEQVRYVIQ